MAIDLGSSNTSRYYSVPDHADFSLPNGDWSWITLVNFPSGQSAANAFYLISTSTVQTANSFNLFISSGTQKPAVVVNTGGVLEAHSTATPTDKWMVFYATRRSSNLYVGHCALDASSTTESIAQTLTSGSNGSLLYLGSRNDLHTGRFWQGRLGYASFVPGYGVTSDDVLALAKGAPLFSMPFAPNIKFLLHGRTASATISDLVSGHVATRQGSSYGTNEEDIQTPYLWVPEYVSAPSSVPSGDTTGSSSGSATVSGVGASVAEASGSSAGIATVSGVGSFSSEGIAAGSSTGTATVAGVGASIAESSGSAAGIATVSGVGGSTLPGSSVGVASGNASVNGVSESLVASSGVANGIASANGIGASTASTEGNASGSATVSGVGTSTAPTTVSAVGTASGSANVRGVSDSGDSLGGDDGILVYEEPKKKRKPRKRIEEILEEAVQEVTGKQGKKLDIALKDKKANELPKKSPVSVAADIGPVERLRVAEEEAVRVAELMAQYQEQVRRKEAEEDEELLMIIAMEML